MGSRAPHPSSHILQPPFQEGQSQGQNSAGGISGLHVAQEDRRQQWATCVSLFKKYIHIELLLVLQWGGKRSGSVGKGRSLHSTSFLPPLQKQRVGCVFYLLYLDLLIVDTHRSQGTGHLLLGAASGSCIRERGQRHKQGEAHRQKQGGGHRPAVGPTADSSVRQHWDSTNRPLCSILPGTLWQALVGKEPWASHQEL